MVPPSVQSLFDWLVDGAPGAPTPMAVISRMGDELRAAGVPVDRISAFVRTLHPAIVGRGFFWQPGEAVRVQENPWSGLQTDEFKQSAAARVQAEGIEVRVRLGVDETTYSGLAGLAKEGFTDYLMSPLTFMGGSTHSISFATKAPGGFTDAQLAAIRAVVRPLCRVAETLALMRTAVNILNTYVGRDAGDRILKGKIQRGDTERIRCVIWFSDLRGFTSLSGERTPAEIISVLNQVFDCQVPHIEKQGGEVLKFMGDGLLAIFPVIGARGAAATCRTALTAARKARDRIAATAADAAGDPVRFGLALHVGEVLYGNIGSGNRLDFTCIGPAVNLAARIEKLAGTLGRSIVTSGAYARHCPDPLVPLGEFALPGFAGAQALFGLPEEAG